MLAVANDVITLTIISPFKFWNLIIDVGDCYGDGGRLALAGGPAVVRDNQTEGVLSFLLIVKRDTTWDSGSKINPLDTHIYVHEKVVKFIVKNTITISRYM